MHRNHQSLPARPDAVLINIMLHLEAERCLRKDLSFYNDWRW